MSAFGIGAFLFALAPDYTWLVASRIVMGLGASLSGQVRVALGSELVKPKELGYMGSKPDSAIAMI